MLCFYRYIILYSRSAVHAYKWEQCIGLENRLTISSDLGPRLNKKRKRTSIVIVLALCTQQISEDTGLTTFTYSTYIFWSKCIKHFLPLLERHLNQKKKKKNDDSSTSPSQEELKYFWQSQKDYAPKMIFWDSDILVQNIWKIWNCETLNILLEMHIVARNWPSGYQSLILTVKSAQLCSKISWIGISHSEAAYRVLLHFLGK